MCDRPAANLVVDDAMVDCKVCLRAIRIELARRGE